MARSKNLSGIYHAHGCRRCNVRYDDACTTPTQDDLCTACRGLRPWQVLIDGALPRDCCRQKARLVTKDEIAIYKLAGTRMWFICPTCARTHPFDPKRQTRPEGTP